MNKTFKSGLSFASFVWLVVHDLPGNQTKNFISPKKCTNPKVAKSTEQYWLRLLHGSWESRWKAIAQHCWRWGPLGGTDRLEASLNDGSKNPVSQAIERSQAAALSAPSILVGRREGGGGKGGRKLLSLVASCKLRGG